LSVHAMNSKYNYQAESANLSYSNSAFAEAWTKIMQSEKKKYMIMQHEKQVLIMLIIVK